MCMVDYADSDGDTFLCEVSRKARKVHKCGECFRQIAPGETYAIGSWAGGGSVRRMKMCAHCGVLSGWLQKNCGGFLWGGVIEDIREHVEEYRGVYPKVARALKRVHVHASHHWRFKRGPHAGKIVPVPAMPPVPAP